MAQQVYKTPVLKDVYTNSLYQSTFLPIFERAETKIKELIFAAFLFRKSKYLLLLSIAQIIADVDKKVPVELQDREQYMRALQIKSNLFVKKYYDDPLNAFQDVREKLVGSIPSEYKAPLVRNPKEALDLIQSKKLWSEAKGYPNVVNYPQQVKFELNRLANEPITTQEPGKKPILLWQKAELDVRYENQMQNLQNLRVEGVQYAWISSHPNASKRCAVWQGSLVVINGHASNPQKEVNAKTYRYDKSSFLVGTVDGHKVYSLPDIMDVETVYKSKSGSFSVSHNNIICGFNCRHRLIPYKPGTVAPKEFSQEELEQQREIENKIREMERTIRLKKKQLVLYNELGDKAAAKQLKFQIAQLTQRYKAYCEKNGYAWYKYRIEV